jgi:hypothetical protein
MAATTLKALAVCAAAFALPLLPAGCGGGLGSGLSALRGESGDQPAAAAPIATATLAPEEIPPLPARRPGKRSPSAAAKTPEPAAAAAAPAGPPQQPDNQAGLSLAALGKLDLFSSAGGPDQVLTGQSPVATYSLLAHRIKNCWLKPGLSRLPNHGFHAEVAPGNPKAAKIVIYEKDAEGRQGISAFRIDITAESDGSLVSSRNVRLDQGLEASFKGDLARWAKGDERCNG